MKPVYKSDFQEIFFEAEDQIMLVRWKMATENMDDNTYKVELIQQLTQLLEYRPMRLLLNAKDLCFTINPNSQAWAKETLAHHTEIKGRSIRRVALVEPENIFARVALEQMTEESLESELKIRFFEAEYEAKNWLLS
jgi:hypothetical protein